MCSLKSIKIFKETPVNFRGSGKVDLLIVNWYMVSHIADRVIFGTIFAPSEANHAITAFDPRWKIGGFTLYSLNISPVYVLIVAKK